MNTKNAKTQRRKEQKAKAETLSPFSSLRLCVFVIFVFLTFRIALAIDAPVNRFVVAHNLRQHLGGGAIEWILRTPGNLWVLLPVAILLVILHRQSWRPAGLLVIAAIVAGTIAGIVKGLAGRARPGKFEGTPQWVWLRGGWHGFWHQTNVSFVSGDATQAFVVAETLAIAVPVLRWPAYAIATLTCLQRVAVGAHYPSDVVGGAVVGVVTVRVLFRILSAVVPPAREGQGDDLERTVKTPAGGAADA